MKDNFTVLPKETEKMLLRMIQIHHSCNEDFVVYRHLVRDAYGDDPLFPERMKTLFRSGYISDTENYMLTDTGLEYVYIKRQYGRYTYWNPAKVSISCPSSRTFSLR